MDNKDESTHDHLPAAVSVGDFSVEDKPLQLGQLAGNRFRLFLRGSTINTVTTLSRLLDKACEVGFPNYYGSQRFTTFHNSSEGYTDKPVGAALGCHLLCGELRDVVVTLFREAAAKKPSLKPVLTSLLNGECFTKLVEMIPSSASGSLLEIALLRNLVRYGAENIPPSSVLSRNKAEQDRYMRAYTRSQHIPPRNANCGQVRTRLVWNAAVSGGREVGHLRPRGLILRQSSSLTALYGTEQEVEVLSTMLASCTQIQRQTLARVVYLLAPRVMPDMSTVGDMHWR